MKLSRNRPSAIVIQLLVLATLAACGSYRGTVSPETTKASVGTAAIAGYANAERLIGLSPASLAPAKVCHGLSVATVTNCSTQQILIAIHADSRFQDVSG